MATATRTFTITTDDQILAALDAAMAIVFNLDPTGETTPTPGAAYTTQCIQAWVVDVSERAAARQTEAALTNARNDAQAMAEQAVAIAKSIQIVTT